MVEHRGGPVNEPQIQRPPPEARPFLRRFADPFEVPRLRGLQPPEGGTSNGSSGRIRLV